MKFKQLINEKIEDDINHFKLKQGNIMISYLRFNNKIVFVFSQNFSDYEGVGLSLSKPSKKTFQEAEEIWMHYVKVPKEYLKIVKLLKQKHQEYWSERINRSLK